MDEYGSFHDLYSLSDADLAAVLRRVSRFDLALAMVGLAEPIRRRLLKALADGSAAMVEQTLERLSGLAESMVAQARAKLAAEAVQLSRTGRIAYDPVQDFTG